MRLLDLFCGAGGAAMGYYRAGFTDIVGVDIKLQPHYPFEFVLGDALEYVALHGKEFDAIHASPPCQAYSAARHLYKKQHPKLIDDVRDLIRSTGKPYIIENVPGAPLIDPFMLCGTWFGLRIIRHRYFEVNFTMPLLYPSCNHVGVYDPWHGDGRTANKFRNAMGIDWMPLGGGSGKSGTIDEAIPPAYTEFIGRQLLGGCKD